LSFKVFQFMLPVLIIAASVCLAEEPAPATGGTGATGSTADADPATLTPYNDTVAGYSFRVPPGYTRLTPEQSRDVFEGLSKFLGKEVGERAERQPPSWFNGPVDPKRPKTAPPALAIGFSEMDAAIDPAQMNEYKTQLEEEYRKRGDRYGELKLEVIKVDGINSLRVEHDIFSPIDNSRSRMIKVSVPGQGRRYDIVFNFVTDQSEGVEKALDTVLKSFKIDKHPVVDEQAQSKWTRIALWTIGCFFAGILLSLLLKVLAGVGEKEPEESGG
jgi:hypothetical protein